MKDITVRRVKQISNIALMKSLLDKEASDKMIEKTFVLRYKDKGVLDKGFIEKRILIYRKIAVKECGAYDVNELHTAESRTLDYMGLVEGESPESFLIKKEEFTLLSEEAKEVLRILIHIPEEFLELPESAFASVRKSRVLLCFMKRGWKREKISWALKQVEVYLRLFR